MYIYGTARPRGAPRGVLPTSKNVHRRCCGICTLFVDFSIVPLVSRI